MDPASSHHLRKQPTDPERTPPHGAFAHQEVEREARPPGDHLGCVSALLISPRCWSQAESCWRWNRRQHLLQPQQHLGEILQLRNREMIRVATKEKEER